MLATPDQKLFLTKEQRKESGLKDGAFTEEELALLQKGIERFSNLHSLEPQELLQIVFEGARKDLRKLFYKYLSTEILPDRAHSTIYYRVKRMLHPNNHKGSFTPLEDAKIIELQAKLGNNWMHIGEELDRMPESCRDRYLKCLKMRDIEYKKGDWVIAEEERLIEVVKEYLPLIGDLKMSDLHKSIPWIKVSTTMKSRSPQQCMEKWTKALCARVWKTVNANIKNNAVILTETKDFVKKARGSHFEWSYQDDLNLLNAVQMQNSMKFSSVIWPDIAKTITHALAINLENDTAAQVRCFTSFNVRVRFCQLQKSVFNGKNLSVLDICLYYLEKDCKRLNELHFPKDKVTLKPTK